MADIIPFIWSFVKHSVATGKKRILAAVLLAAAIGFGPECCAVPDEKHNIRKPQGNGAAAKAYRDGVRLVEGGAPEALKPLNKAIRLDPKMNAAYLFRGIFFMDREGYTLAIKDFDMVERLQPKYIRTYMLRAYCYARQAKWPLALRDYTKAIVLEPSVEAFTERSKVYARMGRPDLAKKDLHAANEYWKNNYNQGEVAYVDKRLKEGSKNIRKLTLYRALRNRDQKKYREAIADFTKVLSIDPERGGSRVNYNLDQIYYDRARCYESIGEYEKAISDYTTILKLDPDSDEAYLLRGKCKAAQGLWQAAVDDYDLCIKLMVDPSKTPFLARAEAYEKLGKTAQAKLDRKKAIELNATGWEGSNVKPRQ